MIRNDFSIPFNPELKRIGKLIPRFSINWMTLALLRLPKKPISSTDNVEVTNIALNTRAGKQLARYFRPKNSSSESPLLYWIHGGGMIAGCPEQDDLLNLEVAEKLGIQVIATKYRLAPEHPAPAAIQDVLDGYLDVVQRTNEFGINPEKIVIGGASAGGGLAAVLSHELRNSEAPDPLFQILIYPMLDDRTTLQERFQKNVKVWGPGSNKWAWRAFLGQEPGTESVPSSFIPARNPDLTGLPPAWLGVGTLDLFHDEDLEYARRLNESGVSCELYVVDGAFHGFDALAGRAQVTRDFKASWQRAIARALDL